MEKKIAECECGAEIFDDHPERWCVKCGKNLPDAILAAMPQGSLLRDIARTKQQDNKPPMLASALRIIGVLDLIASLIVALYVWTSGPAQRSLSYVEIAAGLSLIIQAIITLVVTWALAAILENVVAIRKSNGSSQISN